MKDYTKYDFAAIVGAEVEITQYGGHKYSGTLKLVGRQNGAILLYPSDEKKPAYWFVIEDIVPGSLTAKIKVEDMSLKQITRHAEALKNKNGEKEVYFMVNSDVLPNEENQILFFGTDTIGDRYRTEVWLKLSDYIDCTDWGWKHE